MSKYNVGSMKKFKGKFVHLVFKIYDFQHDMFGTIMTIGSLAFSFQPNEIEAFPLTYEQIISIEEIKK
jgi:hypothetical protein